MLGWCAWPASVEPECAQESRGVSGPSCRIGRLGRDRPGSRSSTRCRRETCDEGNLRTGEQLGVGKKAVTVAAGTRAVLQQPVKMGRAEKLLPTLGSLPLSLACRLEDLSKSSGAHGEVSGSRPTAASASEKGGSANGGASGFHRFNRSLSSLALATVGGEQKAKRAKA